MFRARRDGTDRDVALKVLKDAAREDPKVREMFSTESDVARLLDHPNLIRAFEAGDSDGRPFIAMELIEGLTLAGFQRQLRDRDLVIPPDISLFIVTELLEGLHALHETTNEHGEALGLVHRDVTPDNVFVAFDGRVLLGDFGVTHVHAFGDASPDHVVGKLGYFAPELLGDEAFDRRSDLFSVGVVLFELLSGERLFDVTDDDAGLALISEARLPRLTTWWPMIDRDLEATIQRALAKRPRDRHETAEAFAIELEAHWSRAIGNPFSLRSLVSIAAPTEARAWASRGSLPKAVSAWPD
ncbi:MAG: serine/threonine protein kinase [Myxococcales bacterium]|nr:serine/threonine protein kinase [Myxococcales bacterium]